ncbi:NAD(P)-dependent oxidoreductase [Kaistia dalseonensis]|uniref:3-hydroxyisobutyrate dehydrogenase-like beta-hydroxyacid dehydrogenase n=1 Tax=Kaistia dalseonensis TaxID=410840 RepID=A0ABU0HD94_9HYPH|nr:NAD(P)-dependent oxidoreductase [Kaistia dalseonensis]MCX5496870.1 NAD(P)-dependent oxidoreductase [Kaistia dalseonensis]MDQ0439496.1 3-hydroxyisobutyrate dehydrogenase-like beta-hydroxyacid dehydrogenase [Kaistia dalseonensis]
MSDRKVGFIGLGYMGEGMAANILAKHGQLTVMANRRRDAVDRLVAGGANEVSTPAEMAKGCDVIFLCVTGSPEVEAVIEGPNGILAGASDGLIVIDCSTAEPTSTVALAARLAAVGARLVDAPLGGTPAGAAAGTLQALVGTDADTFAEVQPLIACWAATIVHVGAVGAGHKMKLINNFISLGYASLYSEALALGQKVGITPEVFHSVIGQGRMRCGFYDTFMTWVMTRDENAHRFTIANAYKDLRYLGAMADNAAVVNVMGSAVKNQFAAFAAAGGAESYVPMLSDFVATQNGTKLA